MEAEHFSEAPSGLQEGQGTPQDQHGEAHGGRRQVHLLPHLLLTSPPSLLSSPPPLLSYSFSLHSPLISDQRLELRMAGGGQ